MPPSPLTDAPENAAVRALLGDFTSLRGRLFAVISHVEKGETQRQVLADSGQGWDGDFTAFASRVDGLRRPRIGVRKCRSNVAEGEWHLAMADSAAHDYCDPVAARQEIAIANYFASVGDNEIAKRSASVGEAADPPVRLTPRYELCHW